MLRGHGDSEELALLIQRFFFRSARGQGQGFVCEIGVWRSLSRGYI